MTAAPHQQNRQAENNQESEMQTSAKEWISLREMQELLGIGSTKAYELASGSIPGVIKIGRIIRINRHDLERWLRQQALTKDSEE